MKFNRWLPFFALVIVYLLGAVYIDIMDIDAAQYANISREMSENNNFLQVQYRQQDYYLDKPPLLFWLTALIFKLFGAYNFTYRLVPILSSLLGIYATYRFCKLYYNTQTAYIAALIVGSCQAFFLMNHDVRCDTLLTNCVMVAIWLLATYLSYTQPTNFTDKKYKWFYFIGAFVFMGLGMLAKGPIALIVVGAAFFSDFALKRQWNQLFRWEWLIGILVVGIVLTPYCIGLYRQYGNEGIYFFFWKQSFGRITGESEWNNSPGLLFQLQNFLWSFLPWVIPFAVAFIITGKEIIQQNFKILFTDEAISFGGFLLPFAALSTAKYQLPHYTFVVFPLAAILTARFLNEIIALNSPPQRGGALRANKTSIYNWIKYSLMFTSFLMVMVVLILSTWAFPLKNILMWVIIISGIFLIIRLYSQPFPEINALILAPFFTALVANFVLNLHFYPSILPFQTGSQLGHMLIAQKDIPLEKVYKLDVLPNAEFELFHDALDFYTRRTTVTLRKVEQVDSLRKQQDVWLYTEKKGIAALANINIKVDTVWQHDRFHVTGLTLPFINPETRLQQTTKQYLVKVLR